MKIILNFLKKTVIFLTVSMLSGVSLVVIINLYVDVYAKAYCYNNLNDIPNAEAVIVLGASVNRDGKPSPILEGRLDNALELYSAGKVKKILLSGDHATDDYDEVNAMKNYLLDKNVPREDLILDHSGFNTYDSMYRAKEIFCVDSLLISTQQFHIQRSVYIARRLGIKAYGYPNSRIDYFNMREKFAKVKAFLDIEIIKRPPRILGDKTPINGNGLYSTTFTGSNERNFTCEYLFPADAKMVNRCTLRG